MSYKEVLCGVLCPEAHTKKKNLAETPGRRSVCIILPSAKPPSFSRAFIAHRTLVSQPNTNHAQK